MKSDTKLMAEGQWQERRQRTRERWQGRQQSVLDMWKTTHCSVVSNKGETETFYANDEDESETIEETLDNNEELQAWCLLELGETEQWQVVISRRDKQKVTKAKHASPLSAETCQHSSSQKIIEVKNRWVKARVTMDYGPAGHVMVEGMFPTCQTRAQNITKEVSGSEW